MARFDTWDSYFYPETYDGSTGVGTLVNKYGERDPDALATREYRETHKRAVELETAAVALPRSYDAEHLKAIHAHLFGNVYEWAGEYRSVGMTKNLSAFADPAHIDRYLADAHRIISETDWPSLDRIDFSDKAAEVFAYVNQAHPFREGNGRASKLLMQQVAELSNFRLDFNPAVSGITPEMWNQASMLSGPDLGSYEPVPDTLRPVFYQLAQPAPEGPVATVQSAQERAAETVVDAPWRSAAFPSPATEATRRPSGPGTVDDRTTVRPPSIRQQVQGYGSGVER